MRFSRTAAGAGLVVLCGAILELGTALASKRLPGPPLPVADWGACPFECCTYGGWVARKPIRVHADHRTDSPMVFQLAKGDSVVADTGVVITRRYGLAVVLRDVAAGDPQARLAAGDTVAVLHREGEGYWKVWLSDHLSSEGINDTDAVLNPEFVLRMVRYPDTEWWARIRDLRGRNGWVREPYGFSHVDRCE